MKRVSRPKRATAPKKSASKKRPGARTPQTAKAARGTKLARPSKVAKTAKPKKTTRFGTSKTASSTGKTPKPAAHSDVVAVQWRPDGTAFVSLHANGDLVVWSAATGEPTKVVATREAGASSLALVDEGAHALVGGDKRVTRWDLGEGKRVAELGKTGSPITGIVAVGAGKVWGVPTEVPRAVGSDAAGNLALFAAQGGRHRIRREHKGAVTGLVAMPGGEKTLSVGRDGKLRLHEVGSGDLDKGADDAPNEHAAVAVLADGKRAVTATGSRLVVWDLAQLGAAPGDRAVKMLASVPGTERVIEVSPRGELRVWDAKTARIEREVPIHAAPIEHLAVMPEGDVAITSSEDGALRSWSIATGEVVCKLEDDVPTRPGALFPFAGGKLLTRGQDDVWLHLWDVRTGDVVDLEREDDDEDAEGEAGTIEAAALAADGRSAVGIDGHRVAVWRLPAREPAKEHTIGGYGYGTITPDGRFVLKTAAEPDDPDRGQLVVWDAATGKRVRSIAISQQPCSVRFDPAYRRFVRTLWEGEPGKRKFALEIWDFASGARLASLDGGHPRYVEKLAWSADGKLLATASADADRKLDDRRPPWERTGVVCLWDIEGQRRLGRWEAPSKVEALAVTPEGRLAVGLYDGDVAFFSVAP